MKRRIASFELSLSKDDEIMCIYVYIHEFIYDKVIERAISFGDFQVIRSNVSRIITFGNNGTRPTSGYFVYRVMHFRSKATNAKR